MSHANKNKEIDKFVLNSHRRHQTVFLTYTFSENCKNIMLIQKIFPLFFWNLKKYISIILILIVLSLLLLSLPYAIQWWIISENVKGKIKMKKKSTLKAFYPRNARLPSHG